MLTMIRTYIAAFASRFTSDDRGATAVEYALLVALVAVALIGALGIFQGRLSDLFGRNGADLNTVNP